MLNGYTFLLFLFIFIIQIHPSESTLDKNSHEGWTYFNKTGYYYKVFNISTIWQYAEELCQSANSHLVSFHSYEELKFATSLAVPFSNQRCLYRSDTWIGTYTTDSNKHWSWTDRSIFNYSLNLWSLGEPDNPGEQNCGVISTGNKCLGLPENVISNHACSMSMSNFICKKFL